MKKCKSCLLPETYETLEFKDDGCNICKGSSFKREGIDWDKRKLELDKLINNHKGKYTYDCIIPFSGGKDSTFTLYYLIKNYGIKPLVVRFNHGFMRKIVYENNQNTFEYVLILQVYFVELLEVTVVVVQEFEAVLVAP